MSKALVLDACSLTALLNGEAGAEKVRNILNRVFGEVQVLMHKLNLLEVYHDDWRARREECEI
jgi:PIN domain nuclease of toxin-antitoxin system